MTSVQSHKKAKEKRERQGVAEQPFVKGHGHWLKAAFDGHMAAAACYSLAAGQAVSSQI